MKKLRDKFTETSWDASTARVEAPKPAGLQAWENYKTSSFQRIANPTNGLDAWRAYKLNSAIEAEKRRKEEARRRLPDDNSLAYQMQRDRAASYLANQPIAPKLDDNSLAYGMLKDRAAAEEKRQSLPLSQQMGIVMRNTDLKTNPSAAAKAFAGTPAQDSYNDYLKQLTDYSAYTKAADFEKYSKQGAAISNPTFEEAQGAANLFGWRPGAEKVGNIVTFSRENIGKIRDRAEADDKSAVVGNPIYSFMRDEEVGIYNYLLAKEGEESAQRYLDSIEEDLNRRYGTQVAKDVEKTKGTALNPLMVGGMATSAGLDQWGSGVKQAFDEYAQPTSAIQYAGAQVREQQNAAGKFAYDAVSTLSNMAPSILASYVAMGLGAPAKVAEWIAAGSLGLGSGGNAYKQALAEGRTKDEAKVVASLTGASEAVLSKLLSGIGAYGGFTAETLLPKVAAIENAIWRVAAAAGVKIGGEVAEEWAQLYLEPLFKTLVYGDKYDAPEVEEVVYTALLTAVTTGLLEGKSIASYRTQQGAYADAGIEPTAGAADKGNIQTPPTTEKAATGAGARENGANESAAAETTAQQQAIDSIVREAQSKTSEKSEGKTTTEKKQNAVLDALFGRNKKAASETDTADRKAPGFYSNDLFAGTESERKYLDNLAKAVGVSIEMAERGSNSNGWIVNGKAYIRENAEDPFRVVAKHEITHHLQDAAKEAYTKYRGFVEEIYRKRGTLDQQIRAIQELYAENGQQLTREEALDELAADFSGELMENEALIRRLAGEDRNIAQRILDGIRNLIRKVKGVFGDAETKTLNRAVQLWESALQEANAAYQSGEIVGNDVVRYSVGDIEGENQHYGVGVILDTDIFNGVRTKDWGRVLSEYVYKNLAGTELTMYDDAGTPETVFFAGETDRVRKDGAKNSHKVLDKLARYKGDNIRALTTVHLAEALKASGNETSTNEHSHQWMDEKGWTYRKVYLQDRNGNIYEATLNIANGRDRRILYDVNNIRKIDTKKEATGGVVPSTEDGGGSHANGDYAATVSQERESVKGSREMQKRIDALERQNQRLKEQMTRTDVPKVRREVVKRSVKELRSMYNSKIDAEVLTERIADLYDKIAQYSGAGSMQDARGVPDWWEINAEAEQIAKDIVSESTANINTAAEEYRDLRKELKGRKISISTEFRSDLESAGGYEGIRKQNFGTFSLSKDGEPIESVYTELNKKHPELFPDDIAHPADMLIRLSDVMEDLKPIMGNPFERDLEHTAEYLKNEIIERFYDTPNESPTKADKMADAFHRQRLRDQKELKARLEKQKKVYEAQAEDLRKRYEQENEERIERQNATQRRQTIFRHAVRLANKLERPTNKQHIPEELRGAALNLLKYINLQSGFEYEFTKGAEYRRVEPGTVLGAEKTGRTLAALELREQLEQIAKNETLTIDPEMNDYLQEIARMGDKTLVEMSKAELDTVWKVMQIVEHTISKANELHEMGRYKTVSDMADAIEESARGREDRKSFIGPVGALDKLVNFDMLAPETFLHKLGAAGDELFKMMRRSEDRQTAIIKDGVEKAEKLVRESGVNFAELEKELHTFQLSKGELTLSTSHIMELYALMKRKQAVDHILKGGLKNVGVVKGAEELRNSQPIHVNSADVATIIGRLTDKQKKLVDGLQEYMSTTLAKHGNEETMKVYGYKKFKEKNYWPIKVAGSEVKSDPTSKMREKMIPAYGMTKLTQPKAKNPVELHSAIDSFTTHLNQMATYAAWLGTNEDITRLINFKYLGNDLEERDNVKRILESVYGKNGEAYLDNLLGDVAQGTKTGRDTALTDVLNANWKAAKVGGNLRVIVQQPTSIFRAMDTLDAKYFLSGGNVKKGWEKAKKHSGIAQWKDWGYFEINTGRSLRELIVGTERGVDKAKNALMWAAGAADSAAWGYLWNAVEAETADNYPGLQKGTDEFYRTVAERFDEIIDRTQVVDSVLHRTQIMRSGNALNKMASNFMSEPSKIYNMVARNIIDLTNAKTDEERRAAIKGSARTFGALTASFAVNALAQSLIDALRDDDRDDEYWEKFAKNYFGITGEEETATEVWKSFWDGNFWQNFNPFGYVPYVKDVMSLIEGYSVDRSDMAAVTELINAMRQFAKSIGGEGKKTALVTGMEAAAKVCDLLGIPASNIKRDVAAAINTALSEFNLYDLQYELDKIVYTEENAASVFYGDIYRAMNGDVDAYTEIYEDFYQGLIKNGASEEDAQEKIKSAMEDKMKDEIGVKSVKSLPVRWEPPTADDSADERARKFLQLLFAGEKNGGWTSQFSEKQLELSREVDAVRDETNLKKAMTVANGDWAEWIKENQLKNIMDDAAYARYTAARSAGVSTKEFVDMLQRADEIAKARGAKNASQADIKQALSESSLSTKKKRAIWNGYVETGVWKTKSPW